MFGIAKRSMPGGKGEGGREGGRKLVGGEERGGKREYKI